MTCLNCIFILLLDFQKIINIDASTFHLLAFAAGGFGNSKSTKKSKSDLKKRKKKTKSFSDLKPAVQDDGKPKQELDKWGLPPVTEEDLFPPMPPGTELSPLNPQKQYYLQDIEHCLREHIDLNLSKCFDNDGIEKQADSSNDSNRMKINLLHESPPVLSIDNFLTPHECEKIIKGASSSSSKHQKVDSATFSGALSTRTSTSWFSHFSDIPILLAKAHHLLNIPLETMEEPQIVRYQRGQEFSWHYDEVPQTAKENGGQRVATLLVYLNDLRPECDGGTAFRDLKADNEKMLKMQPKRGSALLFFPAFANGAPDDRTLHRSEVMTCDDEKWIVQMWVHQHAYQAVLPPGNSNIAAQGIMEHKMQELGYQT
mmetsp:Transcript_8783/g.13534  ORF Transcript_8783/g.13534 Transcript_8783/m.13534 type:complete len:371 (+) Transcript_8783:66-1178(+)